MLNEPYAMGRAEAGGGRFALVLSVLVASLMVFLLALTPAAVATQPAGEGEGTADGSGSSLGDQKCGVEVVPQAPTPRQVNLVLDDSDSMFSDGTSSVDRWSNAKYSLEVFAAMLGPDDVLNVYRTSDFVGGKTSGAATTVLGSSPIEERIATIHRLDMIGGGTL